MFIVDLSIDNGVKINLSQGAPLCSDFVGGKLAQASLQREPPQSSQALIDILLDPGLGSDYHIPIFHLSVYS